MLKLIKNIDLACGQTYLVETQDNHLLELGDVFMNVETERGTRPYHYADFANPSDINKRVMTICTLAGCPMRCTFCASSNTYTRKLTCNELIDQVDFMITEGTNHNRSSDPNQAKEFRVLYTRMGEPMLNVENVIESIKILIDRYPHINIGMSTSGIQSGVERLIAETQILNHIDMQFSVHATNDDDREKLFNLTPGKQIMDLDSISNYADRWFEITGKPVCLNFILFSHLDYDFTTFARRFNPANIWLRLSPWNEIAAIKSRLSYKGLLEIPDVEAKKPISSSKLKTYIQDIEAAGFSYAYAPAIDEEIKHNVACGQALEAFKTVSK